MMLSMHVSAVKCRRFGPTEMVATRQRPYSFPYVLSAQKPEGRIRRSGHLEGVIFDDRSPVIYERNDLLVRSDVKRVGGWSMPVNPGGLDSEKWRFVLGST